MNYLERLRQFQRDRSGTYGTDLPAPFQHQTTTIVHEKHAVCEVPKVPEAGTGGRDASNHITLSELGVKTCYLQHEDDIRQAIETLVHSADYLSLDIETAPLPQCQKYQKAGLDPYMAQICLLQLYDGGDTAYVLDVRQKRVGELFASSGLFGKEMFAHNALFELKFLLHAGVELRSFGCTMLQANALDGSLPSLSTLAQRHLGKPMDKQHQTADWSAPTLSAAQLEYAALDAVAVHRIAGIQAAELSRHNRVSTYQRMVNAQRAIARLELNGCPFDRVGHEVLVTRWRDELVTARSELDDILGPDVNPASGKQIGTWLIANLSSKQASAWPRTPKGALKTDHATLQRHQNLPLTAPLLRFKDRAKRLSTYGQPFSRWVHPVTSRVHASFRIGGTATGRLACREPNLQNAPRDPDFRRLFVATPGHLLVVADYSQIELRVAALLSGDPAMLAAYQDGEDLHTKTAAAVLGIPAAQITKEQRQMAKAVNFGLLFGQGAAGLAAYARSSYGVTMTVAEASQARQAFFSSYKGLMSWQARTASTAKRTQCVATPGGRVRDFRREPSGYRYTEALNTPVQGGAAEVMLHTLALLDDVLEPSAARLINCIHDELVLEVPEDGVERVTPILEQVMCEGFLQMFPEATAMTADLVEARTGRNWQEAK